MAQKSASAHLCKLIYTNSLHEPNHFRDVASEVKLVLDAAGRLAPRLPSLQRQELGMIYWGDKT